MITSKEEYEEAIRHRRTLQKRINRFTHEHTTQVLAYTEAECEELTAKVKTINQDIDTINELAVQIEAYRHRQNRLADHYNTLLGGK